MRGIAILLLVVVFFYFLWPSISRWLKRKAMQKAEDYMRASMGMPPRNKKHNKNNGQTNDNGNFYGERQRRNPFGPDRYTKEPIIPKDYAEDVEFVETINYSETEYRRTDAKGSEIYHESQISDAEYVEIKKPRAK